MWLNTGGPLRKQDLKGKFVLLDFWTYCCINCMHILPELKKLEQAYPNTLVVIGVHSAKFATEQETQEHRRGDPAVRNRTSGGQRSRPPAVEGLRNQHAGPRVILVDPEGMAIWGRSGEITAEQVEAVLKRATAVLPAQGPAGRVAASLRPAGPPPRSRRRCGSPARCWPTSRAERLFISDSNHNRIVVATLDGRLQAVIGSGAIGARRRRFRQRPRSTIRRAWRCADDTLYVADTENHLLRQVDLDERTVRTIAGTGQQNRGVWAGRAARRSAKPRATALNSPWDLWIHGDDLFIAMAGPHQIWRMALDEAAIGPYAGNGREDIVDGPLVPARPFQDGYACVRPAQRPGRRRPVAVRGRQRRQFDPRRAVRPEETGADGGRHGAVAASAAVHVRRPRRPAGAGPAAASAGRRLSRRDDLRRRHVQQQDQGGRCQDRRGRGTRPAAASPGRRSGHVRRAGGISYAAGRLFVADTNNHLIRTIDLATAKSARCRSPA